MTNRLQSKVLQNLHTLLQNQRWTTRRVNQFDNLIKTNPSPSIHRHTVAAMLTEKHLKLFSFKLLVETLLFVFPKKAASTSQQDLHNIKQIYSKAGGLFLRLGIPGDDPKRYPAVLLNFADLSLLTSTLGKKLSRQAFEHFSIKVVQKRSGWSVNHLPKLISSCARSRHKDSLLQILSYLKGLEPTIGTQRAFVALFSALVSLNFDRLPPAILKQHISPWELPVALQQVVLTGMNTARLLAPSWLTDGFDKHGLMPRPTESELVVSKVVEMLYAIKCRCMTYIAKLLIWVENHSRSEVVIDLVRTIKMLPAGYNSPLVTSLYQNRVRHLLDASSMSTENCVRCFIIVSELSKLGEESTDVERTFVLEVLQAALSDPIEWFGKVSERSRVDFIFAMKAQPGTPTNINLVRSLEKVVRKDLLSDPFSFYRLIVSLVHFRIDILPYLANYNDLLRRNAFFSKSCLQFLETEFSRHKPPPAGHRTTSNRSLEEAWAIVMLNNMA